MPEQVEEPRPAPEEWTKARTGGGRAGALPRSVPHSAGVRRGGLPAQAPSHASDSYARWGEPGKEPRRSERRRRVSLHYRTRLCDKQPQQFRLQALQNADLTQTERGSCVGSERSRLCSTRAQPSSFISSKAKAGAENSR